MTSFLPRPTYTANSQFGSSDSEENGEGATTSQTTPKVVLSTEKNETELSSLPPALRRRMKMRRSTSPSGSPADSPKTSPPDSTFSSPKNSPRSSPILKRRGIQKLIRKKQRVSDIRMWDILFVVSADLDGCYSDCVVLSPSGLFVTLH